MKLAAVPATRESTPGFMARKTADEPPLATGSSGAAKGAVRTDGTDALAPPAPPATVPASGPTPHGGEATHHAHDDDEDEMVFLDDEDAADDDDEFELPDFGDGADGGGGGGEMAAAMAAVTPPGGADSSLPPTPILLGGRGGGLRTVRSLDSITTWANAASPEQAPPRAPDLATSAPAAPPLPDAADATSLVTLRNSPPSSPSSLRRVSASAAKLNTTNSYCHAGVKYGRSGHTGAGLISSGGAGAQSFEGDENARARRRDAMQVEAERAMCVCGFARENPFFVMRNIRFASERRHACVHYQSHLLSRPPPPPRAPTPPPHRFQPSWLPMSLR